MNDSNSECYTSRLTVLALIALCFSPLNSACSQTLPTSAPVASDRSPLTMADGDLESRFAAEDLHDLSLKSSPLVAVQPLAGGTASEQGYTRELLQLQWRDGDPIDVYVIRPTHVAKPRVTIYLYGYPVDDNRFTNDEFCRLATRSGGAAIGFVPALTGQRYHGVPIKTWFVSELHDSIVRTVHDVQMLINYAESRADLNAEHIAIFGQGAGATIAGLAATVDPRISAIDLLDPWGDWPLWMVSSTLVPQEERTRFLAPQYLSALTTLDPVHWLPSLAGRPLKVDDVLYETGTPPEAKRKIETALPSSAVLVRYATKAEFENKALAGGQLLAWIQQQQAAPALAFTPAVHPAENMTSSLSGGAAFTSAAHQGDPAQ